MQNNTNKEYCSIGGCREMYEDEEELLFPELPELPDANNINREYCSIGGCREMYEDEDEDEEDVPKYAPVLKRHNADFFGVEDDDEEDEDEEDEPKYAPVLKRHNAEDVVEDEEENVRKRYYITEYGRPKEDKKKEVCDCGSKECGGPPKMVRQFALG
jgi:hypothetical protein